MFPSCGMTRYDTIFCLLSPRTSVHYRAAPNASLRNPCCGLVTPDSAYEDKGDAHTCRVRDTPTLKQRSMRKEVRRWPESRYTQTRRFPVVPFWQRQAVHWLVPRPADSWARPRPASASHNEVGRCALPRAVTLPVSTHTAISCTWCHRHLPLPPRASSTSI